MGRRKRKKKNQDENMNSDIVIDLEEQREARREARRRELREAAAESRRRRGVSEDTYSDYNYYGYPEKSAEEAGSDAYSEEASESEYEGGSSGRGKKQRKKGLTPARIAVFAAVCFILICVFVSGWNIVSLKMEEKESKEKIEALKAEKAALEAEVGKIGTDEYIEEQARQWLKMAKSGEIIYVFDEEKD